MGKVLELSESDFNTAVLQSDIPVLVDFWSPTCGPCRQLVPVLEQLAEENEGDAVIAKFNVFDSAAIAAKYGVSTLPTLLFFNEGAVVQRLLGVHNFEKLQDVLDSI